MLLTKLPCVKMWRVIYFNQGRTTSFRRQEWSITELEFVCRSWMILKQLLWWGCPKWLTAGPHHWPQRKGKLTFCSQVSLWQSWRWIFPGIVWYRGISVPTLPPALSAHILSHLAAPIGQEPYLETQKSSPVVVKEFSLYLVHKNLLPPLLNCRYCSVATLRLPC